MNESLPCRVCCQFIRVCTCPTVLCPSRNKCRGCSPRMLQAPGGGPGCSQHWEQHTFPSCKSCHVPAEEDIPNCEEPEQPSQSPVLRSEGLTWGTGPFNHSKVRVSFHRGAGSREGGRGCQQERSGADHKSCLPAARARRRVALGTSAAARTATGTQRGYWDIRGFPLLLQKHPGYKEKYFTEHRANTKGKRGVCVTLCCKM